MIEDIARAAGERVLKTQQLPLPSGEGWGEAMARNDAAATEGLQNALKALNPHARWFTNTNTDDVTTGDWWVVDPVEGNINLVHGMADWAVTITLLRDGVPEIAVVHQPIGNTTFTARRGEGAWRNGKRLHVSSNTTLAHAIVCTGQAEAGQVQTYERIGRSITAMLKHSLLVRADVPSTFPILRVAGGQHDVFWQYAPSLPGIAAGVLFVTEAGGTVTQIDGSPWTVHSPNVLFAAPGVHAAAIEALR